MRRCAGLSLLFCVAAGAHERLQFARFFELSCARCGSTFVDEMLASHPCVLSVGEKIRGAVDEVRRVRAQRLGGKLTAEDLRKAQAALAEAEAPRTAGSVPGVGEKARVPPAPSASAITACFIGAVPCAQPSRLVALAHPLERDGGSKRPHKRKSSLDVRFFSRGHSDSKFRETRRAATGCSGPHRRGWRAARWERAGSARRSSFCTSHLSPGQQRRMVRPDMRAIDALSLAAQ